MIVRCVWIKQIRHHLSSLFNLINWQHSTKCKTVKKTSANKKHALIFHRHCVSSFDNTTVYLFIYGLWHSHLSVCLHFAKHDKFVTFWGWGPKKMECLTLKFELCQDFCTPSCSEVIMLTNKHIHKHICQKYPPCSVCYAGEETILSL